MPFVEEPRTRVSSTLELALLGRVFDRLKIERQSEQRHEALASRILANYFAGITDEDELVSVSKLPLGR